MEWTHSWLLQIQGGFVHMIYLFFSSFSSSLPNIFLWWYMSCLTSFIEKSDSGICVQSNDVFSLVRCIGKTQNPKYNFKLQGIRIDTLSKNKTCRCVFVGGMNTKLNICRMLIWNAQFCIIYKFAYQFMIDLEYLHVIIIDNVSVVVQFTSAYMLLYCTTSIWDSDYTSCVDDNCHASLNNL